MPSPLGHAIGGVIIGLLTTKAQNASGFAARIPWPKDIVTLAVVACLPDLDFIWGRHSMETHSLGAALLVGFLAIACTRDPRFSVACSLAWASHVAFDWLGSDTTPPLGVMALWPFSSEFFFGNVFVFEAISRRYWLENFWWHNTRAVASEVLILGPLALLAIFMARRSGRALKVPGDRTSSSNTKASSTAGGSEDSHLPKML